MSNSIELLKVQIEITQMLIQLESVGKWDKENPWVKRSADGRFSKNNETQSSQEQSGLTSVQSISSALVKQILEPVSIEDINNQTQKTINNFINSPAVKEIRDRFKKTSENLGKEASDAYKRITKKFDSLKSDLTKATKETLKEAGLVLKGVKVKPGLAALGVISALSATVHIAAALITHPVNSWINQGFYRTKPSNKASDIAFRVALYTIGYTAYRYFSRTAKILLNQSADIFAELRDEGVKQEIGKIQNLADEAQKKAEESIKTATQNALSKVGLDYDSVIKEIDRQKSRKKNQKENLADYESQLSAARERKKITEIAFAESLKNVMLNGPTIEAMSAMSQSSLEKAKAVEDIEKFSTMINQIKGDQFSLEKRVFELQEIIENEGVDSNRAKWRIGVIQSATKYGETIDRLADDRNFNKNPNTDYGLLINQLTKQKPPKGNFNTASQKDNSTISSQFNIIGQGSITPTEMKPAFLELAKSELGNLQKLIHTPLNIQIDISATRPFSTGGASTKTGEILKKQLPGVYDQLDYFNQADGYINLGDTAARYGDTKGANMSGYDELADPATHTREIIFHEAGHILEMKQDAVSVSAAFREDRANETPLEKQVPLPPGMGGMNGQTDAALDRFLSPYQGLRLKLGNSEIATEVVSSGFEALGSPHLASRMAQVDSETFLYALSLADKA